MTNYRIPFDMKFEDKIFNGMLTVKQLIFFIPSILLVGILWNTPSLSTVVVNGKSCVNWVVVVPVMFIAIILFILAGLFALIIVNGESLDEYLISSIKFKLRKKDITFYE